MLKKQEISEKISVPEFISWILPGSHQPYSQSESEKLFQYKI